MGDEIIIGLHSVAEAVKNKRRTKHTLYATAQGEKNLKEKCRLDGRSLDITRQGQHDFQETVKAAYRQRGFDYKKNSTGLLLLASATPIFDAEWMRGEAQRRERIKIICLDGTTDVHNIGAVLRTAAFYGAHALVFSRKKSFVLSPGIGKMSSGALEHVPLVRTDNLPKMLRKLGEAGVDIIGLSQHAPECYGPLSETSDKCALVLGSEEKGLSPSVVRNVSRKFSLKSRGNIQSLNVSVAAALGMQFFLCG